MNINQLAKLKTLIATSPLLSEAERVEWNGLLELMNDKQLGELEKILASLPISKPSQPVSELANKLVSQPVSKELAGHESPGKQMPKLSHIVNIPRMGGSAGKQTIQPANKTVLPEQNLIKQGDKKSGFANKLKNIFAEKELTTSKPQYPLEIPEHVAQQQTVRKEPVVLAKPQQEKLTVHLPEVAKPSPIKAPSSHTTINKSTGFGAGKEIEELLKKIPKPALGKQKSMSDVATASSKDVQVSEELSSKTAPGIDLSAEGKEVRDMNLEKLKKDFLAKDSIETEEPEKPLNKNIVFNNLEDLSKMAYKLLDESDLDALVKKIKEFVYKYGYFDVLFNIEESPLFKSYLNTGLKLMAENKDFIELDKTPSIERFMNKRQFEKFTDLLSRIQGT